MDFQFKAISLIILSLFLLQVEAHGHENHGGEDDNDDDMMKAIVEKPLNELVPVDEQDHLMDKTIIQIITEYVNDTTFKTLKSNMSLSMHLVDALNKTSFGTVKSCLNSSDIDVKDSLKEILETVVEKFQLNEDFKNMKIMKLKAAGLGDLVAGISANNSLEFCSKFSMVLKMNYSKLLAHEASLRTNLNATEFENAYQHLNVSSAMLMKFILAQFNSDVKDVAMLREMIKKQVMTTFDEKQNLKKTEKLFPLIEKEYNLASDFVTKELVDLIGLKNFIIEAYKAIIIEKAPGYYNDTTSIKDLILAALPIDGIIANIVDQPIGVVRPGKSLSDYEGLRIPDITSLHIGDDPTHISSGHLLIRWLYEHRKFGLTGTTFSLKAKFGAVSGFKEIPFVDFISIKVADFIKLYQPFKIPTKEEFLALGKKSFAANGPLIFPVIPINMIKETTLAEDFNVQHFATTLQTFFQNKDLLDEVRMNQVIKFFLKRYTGKYLESQFGHVTLGELVSKIATTHGPSFPALVITGNIQQAVELCAGSGTNFTTDNILEIAQKCIGVNFNRLAIIGQVSNRNFSKLDFDGAEKQPLGHLLVKLKMQGTNFQESGGSIRELLVMSSAPSGFLLSTPIKDLVNISDPHTANVTIIDILGEGRSKFGMNETSDIQLLFAWMNHPDLPHQNTLQDLAAHVEQNVESIGKFSLGEILNMIKAMAHKPFGVKLPISQLLVVCNLTSNMTLELKTITEKCIQDDSMLNILGYPKIKSFNVLEIYKLSGGKINLIKMPNLLGIVDITNYGFDQIIKLTAEPLVLLARGKNISLSQLKNQTMETTLIQIFDADKQIIRKVFSDISEEIYKLVSETPLKDLVDEDSGLKSVQELYTGSVQTMAATVLANETSTGAIEKHLPRYVLLISKMKFPQLFHVYETNTEMLQDHSLVDIVHHLFGDFSAATFKKIFEVDGQQFGRLQKVTFKLAMSTHQHLQKPQSHDVSTLYSLLKFAVTVESSHFDFLTKPISELFKSGMSSNSTVEDLLGYNTSYSKHIQGYIPQSFKSSAKSDILKYLLETEIITLAESFGYNLTQVEKVNVVKLVQQSLKAMNECAIITQVCPQNGFCMKKEMMKPFQCQCNDGFSGNGTTCEDACKSNTCGGDNGVCINDVNGPVCRCSSKYVFDKSKGKCKSAKRVIKIKGLKFRENYDPDYANTKSKKFLKLIEKLEPILLKVLQKKFPNITNFIIVSVTKGSIVVDGEAFTDDEKVTPSSIQQTFVDAAQNNDTDLNQLNPATNFTALVDEEDPCKSNPCGEHATCSAVDAATHSCKCDKGYERDDNGKCKEEDDDDDNLALKVALPVCLILALLLIIVIVVCCSKKKEKQQYKSPGTEMSGAANAGYDN
ncbi:uncharacterized protein [Clytia hemisphaerica]|uniref:EGF-like domain-containing protein n=1 Tax=Clytia hemisphaerica TaxID=252671 RepID=A0A7M5XJ57_9CNID